MTTRQEGNHVRSSYVARPRLGARRSRDYRRRPVRARPPVKRHANPWIALALAVVAIDVVAIKRKHPTLTASFRGAVKHPVRRWWALAAWGILTSHLVLGRP